MTRVRPPVGCGERRYLTGGGGDGDDHISVGYRRDIYHVYGDKDNGVRGNESDDFVKGGADGDDTMYGEHELYSLTADPGKGEIHSGIACQ